MKKMFLLIILLSCGCVQYNDYIDKNEIFDFMNIQLYQPEYTNRLFVCEKYKYNGQIDLVNSSHIAFYCIKDSHNHYTWIINSSFEEWFYDNNITII